MELSVAVRLIKKAILNDAREQTWADLGSGKGLFSNALQMCLPSGSVVHAIDRDAASLNMITSVRKDVSIQPTRLDFSTTDLGMKNLDGLLMANSFHFIQQKELLITRLLQNLKPQGRIVFLEYDMDSANRWVPYPISFKTLSKFATSLGMSVEKLDEEPSVYQRASIYSAVLTHAQ
jgi:trans-aconitate methyltransferase